MKKLIKSRRKLVTQAIHYINKFIKHIQILILNIKSNLVIGNCSLLNSKCPNIKYYCMINYNNYFY